MIPKRPKLLETSAALLAALSFSASAIADEPLELEWTAPKGCPTKEEVLKEVERIVASGEVRRHVRATATVTSSDGHWSLALRTEQGGGEGERTLEGHTCKAVASATALVLALTLQTDPEPTPAASLPRAQGTSAPAPSPPPAPEHVPTIKTRPPAVPVVPFVRLGGGVASGAVPGASGAFLVAGGARYDRFEASATFAFVGESAQLAQGSADSGGTFSAFLIGASACAEPLALFDRTRLELWACAGAEAELTRVRTFGALECNGPGLPDCGGLYATFAPTLTPRITLSPMPSVGFTADATLAFPLERPRFVALASSGQVESVFRASPVSVRAGASIELRF